MSDTERIYDLIFNAKVPSPQEIKEFCLRIADIRTKPREEMNERLHQRIISDHIDPDAGERFVETYLSLIYDEDDENFIIGELTKVFGNRKVAECVILLKHLVPDFPRLLLLLIICHPDTPPLLMLSRFCSCHPIFNTKAIIRNVISIYDATGRNDSQG